MKKIFIVVFSLCLFAQVVYSGQNRTRQNRSSNIYIENELSFENNDHYNYLTGTLPKTQVFFNSIPEQPNSITLSEKIKSFVRLNLHSRNKINHNLSLYKAFIYNRYSSAIVQIYLKTACFRL